MPALTSQRRLHEVYNFARETNDQVLAAARVNSPELAQQYRSAIWLQPRASPPSRASLDKLRVGMVLSA